MKSNLDARGGHTMTVEVNLTINDASVAEDYFVQSFIDHTVSGMI